MSEDATRDAISEFIDKYYPRNPLAQKFTALYGPTTDLLDVFIDTIQYHDDYFSEQYDEPDENMFNELFIMYISRKYKEFTEALLAQPPATLDKLEWKNKGRAFGSLGVGDVDAYASGSYRPHTCNLINTTTSLALTYYMLDLSAQLSNVCIQPELRINRLGITELRSINRPGITELASPIVQCNQEFSVFFVSTVIEPTPNKFEGHSVLLVADHRTSTWALVDVNRTTSGTDIETSYYPYQPDAVLNIFLDKELGGTWSESADMVSCPNIVRSYLDDYVFTGYCGPYSALTVLHRFCGTRPPTRTQYGLRIDLLNLKEAIFDNAAKHAPNDFKDGRWSVEMQIRECKLLRTPGTRFRPCGD